VADAETAGRGASRGARFALGKFRLPPLPSTLVTRSVLHDRLMAGAGQRLTVVVGSAGAGKSVLLSSWAATRAPHVTSWPSLASVATTPPGGADRSNAPCAWAGQNAAAFPSQGTGPGYSPGFAPVLTWPVPTANSFSPDQRAAGRSPSAQPAPAA
jgi:hypothetical protein